MRIIWIIVGIFIAIGLFLLLPGVFHTLVSWVQSAFHSLISLGKNATGV
jgi:hypothetical protein